MPVRQVVRRRIKLLIRGMNARGDLGPEQAARALWRSYLKGPLHPFLIRPDDMIVDGNCRHWGAELEGDTDAEVDCMLFEGEATPERIARAQFNSAIHRADWSLHAKCLHVIESRDAHPDVTLKDLATELEIDAPTLTKWLKFEHCIERVKKEIQAGRIGLRDMVSIGSLPPEEQDAVLDERLNGGSAAEVERESRKRRSRKRSGPAPTVRRKRSGSSLAPRASRIRIPVANVTVTFSGKGMTVDDAIGAGVEAVKKMQADRLNAATAQAGDEGQRGSR